MNGGGPDQIPLIEGTRIHWLWEESDSDFYLHEASFISEELYEYYGQFSFHTTEEPVPKELGPIDLVTLRIDTLRERGVATLPNEIEHVIQTEHVTSDRREEVLFSDELQELIRTGRTNRFRATITPTAAHIDTLGNHAQHEDQLRQNQSNLSDQAGDSEYSGPLFSYSMGRRGDPESEDTLFERESPINVSWESQIGLSAVDVGTEMANNGWDDRHNLNPRTRYVIISDTSGTRVHGQDDNIGKSLSRPFAQWHCRFFSIPDAMDHHFDVAGQAHRDPFDHNQVQQKLRNAYWQFASARQEVTSDWMNWNRSNTDNRIGNDNNFPSSNGVQGQIGT